MVPVGLAPPCIPLPLMSKALCSFNGFTTCKQVGHSSNLFWRVLKSLSKFKLGVCQPYCSQCLLLHFAEPNTGTVGEEHLHSCMLSMAPWNVHARVQWSQLQTREQGAAPSLSILFPEPGVSRFHSGNCQAANRQNFPDI